MAVPADTDHHSCVAREWVTVRAGLTGDRGMAPRSAARCQEGLSLQAYGDGRPGEEEKSLTSGPSAPDHHPQAGGSGSWGSRGSSAS